MDITELALALAPWVVIFGVFWFLFIRPQKKKRQQREDMLDRLETGDEVVTIGGIKGSIKEIGEEEVTLEVAPETNIKVNRNAVGSLEREENQT